MQAIYKEFGMIVEPLLDTFLFCFYLEIYQFSQETIFLSI